MIHGQLYSKTLHTSSASLTSHTAGLLSALTSELTVGCGWAVLSHSVSILVKWSVLRRASCPIASRCPGWIWSCNPIEYHLKAADDRMFANLGRCSAVRTVAAEKDELA